MIVLSKYKSNGLYFHHALDNSARDIDFPMHAHEECELFIHIRGKGKYIVEGVEYALEPGCIIIVRPYETHKLYIDPTKPYERIVIEFSEDAVRLIDYEDCLLKAFFDRPLGYFNQYFNWEFKNTVSDHIDKITVLNLSSQERRLNIIINLLAILYEINQIFNNRFNDVKNFSHRNLVSDIVEYVNTHLFDDLSLKNLCRQFFISQTYLSRIFKISTGASVAEYISIKRLIEAKRKLQLGQSSVSVAKECGYNDYSAFFRAYKKRFDISPSEEKKKVLNT